MKLSLVIFPLILQVLTSCDNVNDFVKDKEMLVIDTYSPEKSTGAMPNGKFDSSPVDLYLDGEFVGTTPVILKESDLKRLNLPKFERIQTETGHWDTWDLGKKSNLLIRHKNDKESKRILNFRTNHGSEKEIKKFVGYTNGKNSMGVQTMLIEFPETSAEQAVPPKSDRAGG